MLVEMFHVFLCFTGYVECGQNTLECAVRACAEQYNEGQSGELVMFRSAALHCARLSRVLSQPGGHALLLSAGQNTGRPSAVRLAAFIMSYQVLLSITQQNI